MYINATTMTTSLLFLLVLGSPIFVRSQNQVALDNNIGSEVSNKIGTTSDINVPSLSVGKDSSNFAPYNSNRMLGAHDVGSGEPSSMSKILRKAMNGPMQTTTTNQVVVERATKCEEWQWACGGTSSQCIIKSKRCDGEYDCNNHQDEFGCNDCNPSIHFKCQNGECISKFFQCDGSIDCMDSSDEQGCPRQEGNQCSTSYFNCNEGGGSDDLCIPETWKCDGQADCLNDFDEKNCSVPACESPKFRCRSGMCISPHFVCDGEADCSDEDDEENCGPTQCQHNPNHYQCKDGGCVLPSQVCNNYSDCNDGTDEGGRCTLTCQAGECSYKCFMTPRGSQCICPEGYKVDDSMRNCMDINECNFNASVCDHFCENEEPGYSCSCAQNYELQDDGATCKTTHEGRARLIVAQDNGVRLFYLNQQSYTQVASGPGRTLGVAYDPVDDMVYWSDVHKVYRVNLLTSDFSIVVEEGLGLAEGLAVDWLGRNLYITDSKKEHILVCSLDGTNCYEMLKNIPHPRGIKLDLINRNVYWTDVNSSVIEYAGMDGQYRRTLVSEDLKWPNALALDPPAERIYWADAWKDQVCHANYDGTDVKCLENLVSHPFAMEVWEDRIYWSDWDFTHIRSCLKRTGKKMQNLLKAEKKFYGISLYHPSMLNVRYNPCESGRCSHLCLLSPTLSEYTCACPTGEMALSEDQHTCRELPHHSHLFLTDGDDLFKLTKRKYGRSTLEKWTSNINLKKIVDFDYNPVQDTLIVSGISGETIYRVNMSTGISRPIVAGTRAIGVAVDWFRNNVYWIDLVKQAIELVRTNGLYRTEVMKNVNYPADLALAPELGYMFVSIIGPPAAIYRCGLDGSHCITIVIHELEHPVAIEFDKDPNNQRLYWSDYSAGIIESVALDGSERRVLKRFIEKPVSIAVSGDTVMWTEHHNALVFTASKFNGSDTERHYLDLGPESEGRKIAFRIGVVGWHLPPEVHASDHPCMQLNGNCSHLCLGSATAKKICACEFGYELADDGKSCVPNSCNENMFLCPRIRQCIPESWKCDGSEDCKDGSDEEDCHKIVECKEHEFQCTSGRCIAEDWTCDGVKDCEEGSDETLDRCANTTCPNGWRCTSGQCIPSMWVCDQHADCHDGSDEENCETTCDIRKFTCRNGDCITDQWRCDGDQDCKDGSDEEGCERTCGREEFTCRSGECIAKILKCDGDEDCNDGSDENSAECRETRTLYCQPGHHQCISNSTQPICILNEEICDGVKDCPQGDDELCDECASYEFTCKTGHKCIPERHTCDHENDCPDGSDEGPAAGCVTRLTTENPITPTTVTRERCGRDRFECDGSCIDQSQVCDDKYDCIDNSDEGSFCRSACADNGGCQHVCQLAPLGRKCSCYEGYKLSVDETSCMDIEECQDEATCTQKCIETKGSYHCMCMPGYILHNDFRTCKPEVGEEWTLVLRQNGMTNFTHNLNTAWKFDFPEGVTMESIDFDPVTNRFIFADAINGIIGTGNKDYTDVQTWITRRKNPQAVSFDHHARNVYFSEMFENPKSFKENNVKRAAQNSMSTYSVIQMCGVATGKCRAIYVGDDKVVPSTAVSVTERRFFYCSNHLGREDTADIITSNMDGKFPQVLWNYKTVRCGSLAIDDAKEKVYWTDMALNTVESVSWEGNIHRVIQQEKVLSPIGLVLSGDWVMWVNSIRHEFVRCNKTKPEQCEYKPLKNAKALIMHHPFTNQEMNACKGKSCQDICTVMHGNVAKCVCENGYEVSPNNENECRKLKACTANPCQGGGICEPHSEDYFICRCPLNRRGELCEIVVALNTEESSPSGGGGAGIAVSLVLLAILIALIALGVYWYKKQPFIIWKAKASRSDQTFRFRNPVFGVMTDQPIVDSSPAPSSAPSYDNKTPLPYNATTQQSGQNFENPSFKADDHLPDTSIDSAVASATDSTSINIAPHQVDLVSPLHQPSTLPPPNSKDWAFSPFNPAPV